MAFANWGYTSADPSASEGEKFLAGLEALGRLLAVGSEWGSYATPVSGSGARAGGSVARTVLREAAEEAGEKLARQTARRVAARGFASLDEALEFQTRQAIRSLPEKLYHYRDEEAAMKILTSGKLGLEGRTLYLTTRGDLTPLQAQLELALPQRNTATAVFEVSVKDLNPSLISRIRRVTGNVNLRPGGGVEVLYEGIVYAFTRVR